MTDIPALRVTIHTHRTAQEIPGSKGKEATRLSLRGLKTCEGMNRYLFAMKEEHELGSFDRLLFKKVQVIDQYENKRFVFINKASLKKRTERNEQAKSVRDFILNGGVLEDPKLARHVKDVFINLGVKSGVTHEEVEEIAEFIPSITDPIRQEDLVNIVIKHTGVSKEEAQRMIRTFQWMRERGDVSIVSRNRDGIALSQNSDILLARTILLDGTKKGYLLCDAASDKLVGVGAEKLVHHAIGLHDGKLYVVQSPKYDKALPGTSDKHIIQFGKESRNKNFNKEAGALEGLKHAPHVVQSLLHFFDPIHHDAYQVMPLYEAGTLLDVIKNSDILLGDRIRLLKDVAKGIRSLHEQNLIHRDIKPGNIFLHQQNGQLRACIGDLGMMCAANDEEQTRRGLAVGTPGYRAPELEEDSDGWSRASDVWSLGLVMFEFLSGEHNPWVIEYGKKRLAREKIPAHFGPLLEDMLQENPKKRITMAEVVARLKTVS